MNYDSILLHSDVEVTKLLATYQLEHSDIAELFSNPAIHPLCQHMYVEGYRSGLIKANDTIRDEIIRHERGQQ